MLYLTFWSFIQVSGDPGQRRYPRAEKAGVGVMSTTAPMPIQRPNNQCGSGNGVYAPWLRRIRLLYRPQL